MNAVNLIPSDARRRRVTLPTSRPTLAVFAGLGLVLVAAVLYVAAANQVTSRQSELARVKSAATAWNAAAARYQMSVQAMQHRSQELADIRQLAATRYQWSEMLSQIGGLTPRDAALTTLTATTSASGTSTGGAPAGATSTGTTPAAAAGATSAGATSAGATPGAAAGNTPPIPAVALQGCAASQSAVAQTMVQLHRATGVTAVTLSSSTGTSSGSSSGGQGGCPFNVRFQVSLTFGAPSTPVTASTASAASTGSTASAARASTSATTTTGAAQ
jgi:Tfp pilus assembly protein PilN